MGGLTNFHKLVGSPSILQLSYSPMWFIQVCCAKCVLTEMVGRAYVLSHHFYYEVNYKVNYKANYKLFL